MEPWLHADGMIRLNKKKDFICVYFSSRCLEPSDFLWVGDTLHAVLLPLTAAAAAAAVAAAAAAVAVAAAA